MNAHTETAPLFDTAAAPEPEPEEREIFVPLAVMVAIGLLFWALLFGAGFAIGRATAPAPVSHTVSCQVAGGPVCTRDAVLDPASAN